MEMVSVSSQGVIDTKEINTCKQEITAGEFESVLKSLVLEMDKADEEKEEKPTDLSAYMFMGETIPLIEKGTILETKMEESSSLKTQIESPTENVIETGKEQLLRDRVLADVNILKEIPKDLLSFILLVGAPLRMPCASYTPRMAGSSGSSSRRISAWSKFLSTSHAVF